MKTITQAQYHAYTEVAAYYHYLHRRIVHISGDDVTDWFAGQMEIDSLLDQLGETVEQPSPPLVVGY